MKNIIITLTAFGFVSGCSVFGDIDGDIDGSAENNSESSDDSSANSSGGFFSKRKPEVTPLEQKRIVPDERILIPIVSEVTVDRFLGGALIKARGTTDSLGYNDINLVVLNDGFPDENGVISYEFKAEAPLKKIKGPTPRSNEVYAGASIPANRILLVKRIRVVAAQNQIVVPK